MSHPVRVVFRNQAMPPIPGYNQWTLIDHAPIAYRIHLNGEDQVMSEAMDGDAVMASIRPHVEPRRRVPRTP